MSDSPNETTGQNGHNPTEPRSESQRSSVFDNLAAALKKGAEDARRASEQALPKLKSAAVEAGYRVAYAAAFAAVFEWTVLKQITPECVKSGSREGAKAGRDAAASWMEKMRSPKERKPTTLLAEPGPTGESTQPGVA